MRGSTDGAYLPNRGAMMRHDKEVRMTNYPAHCLDEDGNYHPSDDIADWKRIDIELDGLFHPMYEGERTEEWLLKNRAEIVQRLEENNIDFSLLTSADDFIKYD